MCESCIFLSMKSLYDELESVQRLYMCVFFVCTCGPTVSMLPTLSLSSLLYLLRNTTLSPLNQSVRKKIKPNKKKEKPENQLNPVCQLCVCGHLLSPQQFVLIQFQFSL